VWACLDEEQSDEKCLKCGIPNARRKETTGNIDMWIGALREEYRLNTVLRRIFGPKGG
jgi:hypothetical protein